MGLLDDLRQLQFGQPLAEAIGHAKQRQRVSKLRAEATPLFEELMGEVEGVRTGDDQEVDLLGMVDKIGRLFQMDPRGETGVPQAGIGIYESVMAALGAEQRHKLGEIDTRIKEIQAKVAEDFGVEAAEQELNLAREQARLAKETLGDRDRAELEWDYRKKMLEYENALQKNLEQLKFTFKATTEVNKLNEDMYREIISNPQIAPYINRLSKYWDKQELPEGLAPNIFDIYFRYGYPDLSRLADDITSLELGYSRDVIEREIEDEEKAETVRTKWDKLHDKVLTQLQGSIKNVAREADRQLKTKLWDLYQGNIIAQSQMTFEEYRKEFYRTSQIPLHQEEEEDPADIRPPGRLKREGEVIEGEEVPGLRRAYGRPFTAGFIGSQHREYIDRVVESINTGELSPDFVPEAINELEKELERLSRHPGAQEQGADERKKAIISALEKIRE